MGSTVGKTKSITISAKADRPRVKGRQTRSGRGRRDSKRVAKTASRLEGQEKPGSLHSVSARAGNWETQKASGFKKVDGLEAPLSSATKRPDPRASGVKKVDELEV